MTKKCAFLAFALSPKWLVKWLANSREDFSVTPHCLEALGQGSLSLGSYCPVLSHRRRGALYPSQDKPVCSSLGLNVQSSLTNSIYGQQRENRHHLFQKSKVGGELFASVAAHYVVFNPPSVPLANGAVNRSLQVEEKTQTFSPCPEPRARAGSGCGKEIKAPQRRTKG